MQHFLSVTTTQYTHTVYTCTRIKTCIEIHTNMTHHQPLTIIRCLFSLQKDGESLIFRRRCPRISHTLFLSHTRTDKQSIWWLLQLGEETEILILGKHWKHILGFTGGCRNPRVGITTWFTGLTVDLTLAQTSLWHSPHITKRKVEEM